MSLFTFYERYWQRPGSSPGDHGYDLAERKTKLQAALRQTATGASILDAGCGNGDFSAFLVDLGYQVTGVDISTTAVERARRVCPQGRLEVASLEAGLPFQDDAFAAAWCSEVLEHLFDVHAALAELNRVLRPGGLLILTTPYHGLIKNLIIALIGFERHYNPYLSHIRFFTPQSLSRCLQRAGFAVEKWEGVGRHWPVWRCCFVVARKIGRPGPAPEIEG